jgi:DNA-binding transcriptional ArsR family regulator
MDSATAASTTRWELYRLLGEPVRLRLLALAAEEELAIGELAELLREGQPNVSRHVAPLKKAGLLVVRKHGTRVLARLSESAERDPVVQDGVHAGRALCEADGSLARVAEVVAERDESAREFFGEPRAAVDPAELPAELPAYLTVLAALLERRKLAVDAGTGPGVVLDALAPAFEQVVAIDRERVQLELSARRMAARGYTNVSLVCDAYDSPAVRELVLARGGADVVFASRVLHHAPRPAAAVEALAALLNPWGALLVLDYGTHDDESMREREADLWLGFSAEELAKFARRAGLSDVSVRTIPRARCGRGPDSHLAWHCLVARRGRSSR